MKDYEIVIGLEVHVELLTASKLFCGCATKFGSPPNTQICPVCAGFPGTLPVINKRAVELALKAAIALNCSPAKLSRFARKHYFYPDLPKNYQISQHEEPLASNGSLMVGKRNIRIKRIHIEEDAGKLIHPQEKRDSLIDFNRGGVPLIEIVTEPNIQSSEEAESFLLSLKKTLEYLEVSDCNMEEGSLRCDANISIKEWGDERLGTKTEIKNLNSFKSVKKALDYEAQRQVSLVKQGKDINQETRLWNEDLQKTEEMRSKEEAHDYRYLLDPDLPPFTIDDVLIEKITSQLGELPTARRERFVKDYGLSEYDAEVLTAKKDTADYFERCVERYAQPKLLANWIMGELTSLLKTAGIKIIESPITEDYMVGILSMLEEGKINGVIAKQVLQESFNTGVPPERIIDEKGLVQIQDSSMINAIIEETVTEHPNAVQDYKNGKEQALSFLIGQIMRKTKGQASPAILRTNLLEYLKKI